MKKIILLLTTLFILTLAGTAYAQTIEETVNLAIENEQAQINGKSVTMADPPKVIDGRTLVPLRFVGEAFSCDVQWNNTTKTATVKLVNRTIDVPIGKDYAVINGSQTEVQVPAQMINGSTYVPLRFIAESLGAKVDFNPTIQTISISMKTYLNNNQNFKMVLPPNWIIDEETSEGVKIIVPGEGYCQVGLIDKGEGITADNFSEFANEFLKKYESKDKLSEGVEGLMVGIAFREDGLIQLHSTKLLNNGIFAFVGALPEASFDANIVSQFEILLYSLENI